MQIRHFQKVNLKVKVRSYKSPRWFYSIVLIFFRTAFQPYTRYIAEYVPSRENQQFSVEMPFLFVFG